MRGYVRFASTDFWPTFKILLVDSCKVKNGGCDQYADCTHNADTFAVVCTCKTGYTNVGDAQKVICKGKNLELLLASVILLFTLRHRAPGYSAID